MLKRILILEDSKERHKAFYRKFIGHIVKIVERSSEAIECLQNTDWDMLFLDHDLGGEEMVESGNGTGYEVAEWLDKNPSHKPGEIVIHSFNPVGAGNMKALLPEAKMTPGCWK